MIDNDRKEVLAGLRTSSNTKGAQTLPPNVGGSSLNAMTSTLRNCIEWSWIPICSIKPYERHPRRHTKKKIDKLKKLIGHFGQVAPIIIDRENTIIDGHAVWQAMRDLGAGEIAVVAVAGRTDPELKALRLALNRLPAEAAWDNENLRAELKELVEISFDLEITGFDMAEIDHVLDLDLPERNVAADGSDIPALAQAAVSARGDIWVCGQHRVGCGDALDQVFVDQVRGNRQADACVIDPPYNVPIEGFVSGKGNVHHREFAQAAGEMSSAEFQTFLGKAMAVLAASTKASGMLYVAMDWRHVYELLGAGRQHGLELHNLCVWVKHNPGMGSLYRSGHELILVFKAGSEPHTNNVELGRHGRNRSNVWQYPGMSGFGRDRDALLAVHPTVKPVTLIADALRDVTKRGGVVLDTFLGSGSTLMAAEETGRVCCGIEIDPLYVDVAIRRWQAKTALDAVHAETGELFCDREPKAAASGGRCDGK